MGSSPHCTLLFGAPVFRLEGAADNWGPDYWLGHCLGFIFGIANFQYFLVNKIAVID